MGTETYSFFWEVIVIVGFPVKLNNPLMGTETLSQVILLLSHIVEWLN